ncbi:MAG: 16S rRNA (uracil(1498)-N(3))-methyltransferase [Holophagales bacterium]|nr:16S rRNA (uracil(1498)-N(3))-methyltransferase [Holophagales bacterium]MYH26719.1 16S rRNA (uracil(1498)-N(3))-methyltransferase [Holophagales bacterium]
MNLLLLEDADFDQTAGSGARAVVTGERLKHVRKVLRAEVGDTLEVGRLSGGIGRGRIVELSRECVVLELGPLDLEPPPALRVTLVLALPRPKFVGRILQAAAAMGVKRILLVHTARVEKSYWQSSVMLPDALRRHLMLGLAQARDTVLPEIECLRGPRDLTEALPGLVQDHEQVLVADAAGDEPCPLGVDGPTALLVGPEGGFLDEELASCENAGATIVSLGRRALRVEHAVVALLSRLAS